MRTFDLRGYGLIELDVGGHELQPGDWRLRGLSRYPLRVEGIEIFDTRNARIAVWKEWTNRWINREGHGRGWQDSWGVRNERRKGDLYVCVFKRWLFCFAGKRVVVGATNHLYLAVQNSLGKN